MDYDLAESLMDAGFQQIGKGSLIGPLDKLVWRSGDRVYAPTLEELIEACGDQFDSLERNSDKTFTAIYSNGPTGEMLHEDLQFKGQTPEEAVANLWLELNKG